MVFGRIIKGVGGLYTVDTENGTYECQARGLFRRQNLSPCVGDFVDVSVIDEQTKSGYLQKIHKRKNEMIRPRVVNIDVAVIVFAVRSPDLNTELLDRFIVLVEKQGLDMILCFNKADLVSDGSFESVSETYRKIGYESVLVSAAEKEGINELVELLNGKVCVLAGPSGVGKSSIVNALFSGAVMETGGLSKIRRGKHTTRHAEFLRLGNGGFVVDTPGFASLTTDDIKPEEFHRYFIEFERFEPYCRFKNCMHNAEPDCAVKNAVGSEISAKRYASYLKMLKREDTDNV